MNKSILCFLFVIASNLVFGQGTYIQVEGDADLSVYLNNQLRGKTTAELNGLIIENVTPGKNLIKIVKEGFTPYEEYITVKPGEVFAYKVKPFTKHLVNISEQGNTGETDKKAKIETGKLVVQSVPIGINITIPDIEGVSNMPKTKDKWAADNIPAGTYSITFTFNEKVITKTIEVHGNDTTRVFVNMLSGDFNTRSAKSEKQEKEKLKIAKDLTLIKYINDLATTYQFKPRLNENETRLYNTGTDKLMTTRNMMEHNYSGDKTIYFIRHDKVKNGPSRIEFNRAGEAVFFTHTIISKNVGTYTERINAYNKAVAEIEALFPKELIKKSATSISAKSYSGNIELSFSVWDIMNGANTGSYDISFKVI